METEEQLPEIWKQLAESKPIQDCALLEAAFSGAAIAGYERAPMATTRLARELKQAIFAAEEPSQFGTGFSIFK